MVGELLCVNCLFWVFVLCLLLFLLMLVGGECVLEVLKIVLILVSVLLIVIFIFMMILFLIILGCDRIKFEMCVEKLKEVECCLL